MFVAVAEAEARMKQNRAVSQRAHAAHAARAARQRRAQSATRVPRPAPKCYPRAAGSSFAADAAPSTRRIHYASGMSRFHPPDGMSELEKTPEGYSARIALLVDDDGTFGRECPQPDCLNYFKLYEQEFLAAEGTELTCPACGHAGSVDTFFTPDQLERLGDAQRQFLEAAGHAVIGDFLREMGGRTLRGKGFSLTYNTSQTPAPVARPLPTYEEQPTLRTFSCPNRHRAVIYDLLTACPYCGPDTPPRAVFDDNLAAMSRRLDDAEAMSPEARAAGEQTTAIEQALTRVISALQNLAKQLHTQADKEPPTGNPWQNLDRLTKQWRKSFGADLLDGLDAEMVKTLRLAFGRRHIIEHNGSVIDARYVAETGEGVIGRRVRLTVAFVRQAHRAAVKLADRL